MMKSRKRTLWRASYLSTILLSILTVTPVVTPLGTYRPMLAGLPYTLWMGLVVTVLLVALTYAATQCYPFEDDGGREAA